MATDTAEPTLYQQLGGREAIAAVADKFYRRVLGDPQLAPFFAATDMARLRRHQAAFLGMALGGPSDYQGRALRQAHRGRGIGDAHFDAVAGHLRDADTAPAASASASAQVLGAVEVMRDDVVEREGVAGDTARAGGA